MTLTFSGWPKAGDKMRFLGRGGHDNEREAALKVLQVGQVLTVESCDVGDWSHSIRFLEVAGNFNGVMFEMDEASQNAPQDSQTLTADERLREAAQWLIDETDAYNKHLTLFQTAPHLVPKPSDIMAKTAFESLRAALNQGQG